MYMFRECLHTAVRNSPVHYAHLCQVQLIPHLNPKSFYLLFLILSLLQKYVFGSTPISIMCEALLLLQYGAGAASSSQAMLISVGTAFV